MALRTANLEDAPDLARICRAARKSAMPYLPDLHTREEDLAFFESELASSRCQVALLGGEVVGFACVRDGWLNHLYISPGFQGQGVGSELLNHFRAEIEQFWVFQRNFSARHFYQKRGYVEVELTDGEGNEEKEPDVRFVPIAKQASGS